METSALRWPTTDNISIHGIQVRNTTSAYMEYKSETCKWIHRLVVLTCIGWHSLGFLGTLTQPGSAGYRAATATKQHYYMTWKTRIQKSKMLTSSFILPRKKANMWMSSSAQTILSDNQKWGTAQLVGHSTEKPGTILMWVRVPGAAKDFSPCQLSVQTLLQPPCAIACINSCAHLKIPRQQHELQTLVEVNNAATWYQLKLILINHHF